jgi:hypothetical protein
MGIHNIDISCRALPLASLGTFFQGSLLKRFLVDDDSPDGDFFRVVQLSDMDSLLLSVAPLEGSRLRFSLMDEQVLLPGDVLISVRGMVQKATVFMGADFPVLVSNNVAVFRHFPNLSAELRLQPVFLAGLLRSDSYEPILDRLYRKSTGTRSLSLKQLGKVAVPIPSQAVQSEFVTLFQGFERFALASQRAVEAQREIVESGVTVLLQEVL